MGCTDSKERPQARNRPTGEHQPLVNDEPAAAPPPAQAHGERENARQRRERAEQEEVRQMAAMLQHEKSRGHHQGYSAPPPQHPQGNAGGVEQASISQLQEMYPSLQREVIQSVVDGAQGNQETIHQQLAELSKPVVQPTAPPPAATAPVAAVPAGETSDPGAFIAGDCVEAFFQGQYYPARVVSQEENGDYLVSWIQDDTQTLVPQAQVRAMRA